MKKYFLVFFFMFVLTSPSFANSNQEECYQSFERTREKIAELAVSMAGSSELDSSGFIQYVYQKAADIELPRTNTKQKDEDAEIELGEIKKGDLLFFKNYSFAGIYVGNDEFVYNNGRGEIKKRSIKSGYFKDNLSGARNILYQELYCSEMLSDEEVEFLYDWAAATDEENRK